MRRSPDSPATDRVWAQAIYAVVERRLTLHQAAQAFGLQPAALQRLVRQRTLQQVRHLPPSARSVPRSMPGVATTSPSSSNNIQVMTPAVATSSGASLASDRYVFPPLNPLALSRGSSPTGSNNSSLRGVAPLGVMTPPPSCELSPDLNDEIVAVLREQFLQQQQYDDYESGDGRYDRLEGYPDADIADVVRAIVGQNGRRPLPPNFPTAQWLTTFKCENDFVDVDDMVRGRSKTSSVKSLKSAIPPQQLQQEHYNRSYEREQQQQFEPEQQRRGDQLRWAQNRAYRQPAAPPPPSPQQPNPTHRRASYNWEMADGGEHLQQQEQQQRLGYYQQQQQQRQPRDENNYRRSASAGTLNGHSDGNTSDRNYRQSNLVPAKVWERAMEDVAIHGMSLRNAAKAHGVHFAALHRRLKKRQQHKQSMPCEPNYIPFEDEAGVVRVIHARAEMGVLMTITELVDLLKRTALKHHSELSEEMVTALVRRFQSRVEQSIRHLIIDWPALPNNVLYRLCDGSSTGDNETDGMAARIAAANAGKSSAPSIISTSGGEGGSLSSSGSSSSLSPHPRSAAVFPGVRKSLTPTWTNSLLNKARSGGNDVKAGSSSTASSSSNNNGGSEATTTTATPSDECESMILRL
ncbi:hypothetical protein PR003_g4573 [Phytophthora rubi]|uniref:HTH psq-type domain-containing protein n=1 Tax=Phytophthora rubi TaxID=129364 RepID=A0A6A3NWH1_9STRA|nr:hypothetical protein PR001_g4886 [Phytophthora rubi]KAE9352075.1 hypothetical protein PR003_g4573 [Phytophthora rubi]